MKILFLSINYWPEQAGIGPVNTWRCEYLAAQGHDVTMCTSFPYYPEWRVAEGYRGRLLQRERRNGVEILRSWMWVPRRPSPVRRMVFEASFLASTLMRALVSRKPDLIYVVSPPLGLAVTARVLSRLWRVPYVFDVMDLQPDAAADLGMLRQGRLVRMLYALERMAYRHAALVTTLTEGMRQKIIGKGIAQEKMKLFPARADERLFGLREMPAGSAFRAEFGLEDKFLVIHSGNMGVKQGLDVVLHAAKVTEAETDISYLIVGDGAAREELQRKAEAMGLENVRFLPLLPPAMFTEMLAAAGVALITQQKTVSDIVFPSKTVTLLAAGCPVIASVNRESEIARVMAESGGGSVVLPEDPAALANEIRALRADPARRIAMSQAGTQYARQFWDGARILPQMEAELMKLAENRKGKTLPLINADETD
jgi:putative colanic acid biosynthesis glycosyltransferase WcaI